MSSEKAFAEMISKIAHDLRSPLTSLQGFSATLVKSWGRFTDEQRLELVETINIEARRMSRIVSEVVDLARLEAGLLELHPADADLRAAVDGAMEHLAARDGAARVVVEVPDGLTAWVDPIRLGHILANLIENAIKFSDDGTIRIAAEVAAKGVRLTVADEGIGIEPGALGSLFAGPVAAAESRTPSATPSGAGLGLYLTRRLVEAHGGTIEATSAPGAGSTFMVTLPREGETG